MNRPPKPTHQELKARIQEIESLDLYLVSIQNIKDLLKSLFTNHFIITPLVDPGLLLYRGIKYETKPNRFSYLSYPPSDKVKIGRTNQEGISRFYCSTEKYVPFYELPVYVGDKIVLSEWRVKKPMFVNNVGYTNSNFLDLNSTRPLPVFESASPKVPELLKEENQLVQNFLAKMFSQDISENNLHLYKLTNAIADHHLGENSEGFSNVKFKGLLYPTIRMQANADNMALTQQTIDFGYLEFEKVEYIEIIGIENKIYRYKILDVAFGVKENVIKWKNLPEYWIWDSQSELYFVTHDDDVIAYDANGQLIQPSKNA